MSMTSVLRLVLQLADLPEELISLLPQGLKALITSFSDTGSGSVCAGFAP